MMFSTFKYITNGPTKGILKLFFQNFIMHRNGPGTSCATFYGDKRPGRSDWSADMATTACANAGRVMHGTDALEDQAPGSRASIDRPVAGTSWQSARTPNTRGHAGREDAMVRAEGAGAHLWDHHDHLQRPCRPPSGQREVLGCRPEVPARHRHSLPLTLEAVVAAASSVGGMETVVGHAADAAAPYSGAHELQRKGALLNSAHTKP